MYALVIIAASLVSPGAQTATVVQSIEASHHGECVRAAQIRSNATTLATCVSIDGAAKLLKGCTRSRVVHADDVPGITESDDLAGYAVEEWECM